MEKIVFLGGNGMAIELYEYMVAEGIEIHGYYAPCEDTLSKWLPYLGDERDGFSREYSYVVASGLIPIRNKMISFIEQNQLRTYDFVSKHAYVSSLATIGKGIQVAPGAAITGNPVIGDYVFINFNGLIAHQSVVGNNVIIGPGAKVTGNCLIGNHVALGSNVALIPNSRIEDRAEIGIGAIPKRHIKSGKYVKCPKSEVYDMSIMQSRILKGE